MSNEVETGEETIVEDIAVVVGLENGDEKTEVEMSEEAPETNGVNGHDETIHAEEATEAEPQEAAEAANADAPTEGEEVSAETDESEVPEEEKISDVEAKAAIEALLFAAEEPLTKRDFKKSIANADKSIIDRALTQLQLEYEGARGIHLYEINKGFQFRTNPEMSTYVVSMFEAKPTRISRAAMETLAIVAYQQPMVKSRIDEIRGVDCTGALKKCVELDMVAVVGQADDIGRPNLYATTERFLQHFNLKSITDLPTLDNFEIDALELLGEDLKDFMPEDEREEILAGHVAAAENEMSLEERLKNAEHVDEPASGDEPSPAPAEGEVALDEATVAESHGLTGDDERTEFSAGPAVLPGSAANDDGTELPMQAADSEE